jgi:hypothetical protein
VFLSASTAAVLLPTASFASNDLQALSTLNLQICMFLSGAEGIRTPDLRRAKAALSRLSYGPNPAWWGEFTAVARRGLKGFAFGGRA